MDLPKKVLVLEDDPFIAADLQKSLEEMGYTVVGISATGEEGLHLARKEKPDIIFADVMLEGDLDGIETMRILREESMFLIIYLTEMQDRQTFARARKTFPAEYLDKPFQAYSIQKSIQLAMDRQMGLMPEPKPFHDTIFLKDEKEDGAFRMSISDILYIQAQRSYCKVFTMQGKNYLQSVSMARMVSKIASPDLIQIHKSVTLNCKHVTNVSGNTIRAGGEEFQLGNKYKALVKSRLGL